MSLEHELEADSYIEGWSSIGGISYEYEQMEYDSPTYSPAPEEEKTGCKSCSGSTVSKAGSTPSPSFPVAYYQSKADQMDKTIFEPVEKKPSKLPVMLLAVIGLILFNA